MKVGPKFYLIPKQTASRQRITMEIMKVCPNFYSSFHLSP